MLLLCGQQPLYLNTEAWVGCNIFPPPLSFNRAQAETFAEGKQQMVKEMSVLRIGEHVCLEEVDDKAKDSARGQYSRRE